MDPQQPAQNPFEPPRANLMVDPRGLGIVNPAGKLAAAAFGCMLGVIVMLMVSSPMLALGMWGGSILIGLIAAGYGYIGVRSPVDGERLTSPGSATVGLVVAATSIATPVCILQAFSGFAPWGRPLRIRGQVVHAELQADDAWAEGPTPICDGLDEPTRTALATLWHHDAQKEHASVPAFSRVSWLLTGLGAPPELIVRTHGAAVEEIVHARRCFALAGGYCGAPQGAMPIPEILHSDLGVPGDPLVVVALESLRDGCLIEDFNADVAGRACERTTDPAALALVEMIARDERSHAEVAWDILAWCLARGGESVARAVAEAALQLPAAGPGAYAPDDAPLVAAADPARMLAHGRVPADEWPAIYAARREATQARLARLLAAFEPAVADLAAA